MEEKQIEKLIDEALHKDLKLPPGLSERLEQQIDALAAQECPPRRRTWQWAIGIAATVAMLITLGTQLRKPSLSGYTFVDSPEAVAIAEEVLTNLSIEMTNGLNTAIESYNEMNKNCQEAFELLKPLRK